tara:strand:+ start:1662 stop:2210 length:549 start_codon:yes stop_codon:yes gene_type:complete
MPNNLYKNSTLLIIDAQERIIKPIKNKASIIKNIKILESAYEILGDDIYITEQIPKKLGQTIPELIPQKKYKSFDKVEFSVWSNSSLKKDLSSKKNKNLIVCGFETHICIQQSVIDLLCNNFKVYIAIDSMGSRNDFDHEIGIKRMLAEGAVIGTSESIIFELCKTSLREEFKLISNLIKNK